MNNNYIYDSKEHYINDSIPSEYSDYSECVTDITNIGWTLGNDCPYKCKHCYSMSAREKGMGLTNDIVDKVISQLKKIKPKTINLGGNEPIFTNGINPQKSLLPYIINQIVSNGIEVGLTTSGITAIYLEKYHNKEFKMLNDIDISIDSPYEIEHNNNRGKDIFRLAREALELCVKYNIERTIIMCAMNWNFTRDRIEKCVQLAKEYGANVRINTLRPTEKQHMELVPTFEQYYKGFSLLMKLCNSIDLTDPMLSGVTKFKESKRCPCGRTSFRIHSITPDGKIPISPCVYLHDYKVGNLLTDDIFELINSSQFKTFRIRNEHPELVKGCSDCDMKDVCGGGCASRAYLYNVHKTGKKSMFEKDPFCLKEKVVEEKFPQNPSIDNNTNLVHKDYLCTWIGQPR